MKRICSLLILTLLFLCLPCFSFADDIFEKARSAAVFDCMREEFIFIKNGRERLPVASTTKIMTSLIALEEENIDEPFLICPLSVKTEGSSMGLKAGDKVTLRELSCGMLLNSGNDAANACAYKIGGSLDNFVSLMNKKAEEMDLKDTRFGTPSGLDTKENLSTACDMAYLAFKALENKNFRETASLKRKTIDLKDRKIYLKNHNRLLFEDENITGVKTGFTKKAGRCLVTSKKIKGREFIIVTLNMYDDFSAHRKAYEKIEKELTTYDLTSLYKKDFIKVTGGKVKNCPLIIKDEGKRALFKGELSLLRTENRIYPFLYAPVQYNEEAGSFSVTIKSKEILSLPLYAGENIPSNEGKGRKERPFKRQRKGK